MRSVLHISWNSVFVKCFSESQRKKLMSSSQKKPGLSSSPVRSALSRLDKESATLEVIDTHLHFMNMWFSCTKPGRNVLMAVIPFEEYKVIMFLSHLTPRCPCIPDYRATNTNTKSLLCLCCGPSSPVGAFDYFFKWIWIITADCPWVGIVIDICQPHPWEHSLQNTVCCWRLKTRLLLFFLLKHVAHIISSPTTLKTLSHLEQRVGTYYSGTQAWNYRVCVSVSPPQSVCILICVYLLPTKVGLAITVVAIWWKHYSFDVILYHISLWQAIREGDELFFYCRGRQRKIGREVCPHPLCSVLHHLTLSRLQYAARVSYF